MTSTIDQTIQLLSYQADQLNHDQYDLLVDIIQHHTNLYHLDQAPIISDSDYDRLFKLCQSVESIHPDWTRADSPTHRVGSDMQDGFEHATHATPLLSLENSFNAQDLNDRDESTSKSLAKLGIDSYTFLMEPKFDGISMELIYTDGVLVQAITRGDGTVGDDVTTNVRTIRSVPLTLSQPVSIRIRGEVMMTKSDFDRINHERIESGEPVFANPRNAAGGSLRQLDSRVTASRNLIFRPYEILS